jgi:glutathione S-transferase
MDQKGNNMRLIGLNRSPYTRRVAVTLRLLDIPHTQVPLNAAAELAAASAINPLGRIPALVLDDGEVLIESGAILDYVDELAGPGRALIPPRGPDRRRVLKLMALATGALDKLVASVYERILKADGKQDQGWLDRCRTQATGGLMALEAEAGEDWLHGGRLTQADITAVCAIDYVRLRAPDLLAKSPLPKLQALSARAALLPAFADTRPE